MSSGSAEGQGRGVVSVRRVIVQWLLLSAMFKLASNALYVELTPGMLLQLQLVPSAHRITRHTH